MEEHKFLQFRESFTSRNQNSERLIKIKPTYSQYQQQSNRVKTENNPTSLSQRFEKSKTISQAAFYQSPILKDGQLEQIDKLKKMKKNDFYGQLHSKDPYIYPKKLEELHPRISDIRDLLSKSSSTISQLHIASQEIFNKPFFLHFKE